MACLRRSKHDFFETKEIVAYLRYRHRGGSDALNCDPLISRGGSITMEVGERSTVLRNFSMKAWPAEYLRRNYPVPNAGKSALPMAFALPGRTCIEVTPPDITSSIDSSWVSNVSIVLNQGRIGPFFEFRLKVAATCVDYQHGCLPYAG